MHSDFRDNFIRFNILKMSKDKAVTSEDVKEYVRDKTLDISEEKAGKELNHLAKENYIEDLGDGKYKLNERGLQELGEVKEAMDKF